MNTVSPLLANLLLTLFFSLTLVYSIVGAIITGSISRSDLHPCFVYLFSVSIPPSMMGIGAVWTGHQDISMWFVYGLVLFLTITSYCAQHSKEIWPHLYNPEQQPIGNVS